MGRFLGSLDYDTVDFVWVSSHYDVHWSGICRFNDELMEFKTVDETDYQAMEDNCPYCKDNGTGNVIDCKCETYTNLVCELYELSFLEHLRWVIRMKLFEWFVGEHWSYRARRSCVSFNRSMNNPLVKFYYKFLSKI